VPQDRCVGRWQEVNHYSGCGCFVEMMEVILVPRYTEVFSRLRCRILVVFQSTTRLLQNSKRLLHLPSDRVSKLNLINSQSQISNVYNLMSSKYRLFIVLKLSNSLQKY